MIMNTGFKFLTISVKANGSFHDSVLFLTEEEESKCQNEP